MRLARFRHTRDTDTARSSSYDRRGEEVGNAFSIVPKGHGRRRSRA